MTKQSYSLSELASITGAQLRGNSDEVIQGVAPLEAANSGDISFLNNPKYRKHLALTRASAIVISPQHVELTDKAVLVHPNPYATYAKIAHLFAKLPKPPAGIHPTAVIGEGCRIHPTASIGPSVVIGDGVEIGENTIICANCSLGEGVTLGNDCRLWSNVTLYYGIKIGHRVQIHSGAVIGSDGFGNAKEDNKWLKVPQLGGVVIGDDAEIGANTTIDRGTIGNTILEKGVRLDNQIQVGHNVVVGEYTAIAACTGISGSVKIGKHCLISGMVGFTGHFEVADHVVITGMTVVSKSITKPGIYSSGTAIEPHQSWRKNAVRFRQLDDMAKKIQELEKKLSILTEEKK